MTTFRSNTHICTHVENESSICVAYTGDYCPLCRAEDKINELTEKLMRATEIELDPQIAVNER
jgi:hypothetical protein